MPGPLNGLRVVDLTTVLVGPYCTQILGDMGAEVIKVESPEGDVVRQLGPGHHAGMGGMFLYVNRNKKSLCVNLKDPRGREIVQRLAATADVVVHNMRHRAMADLGLSYPAIAAQNPRVVYCNTYGFSRRGPYGTKPAYDDIIQGASGLAQLEGAVTGRPHYVPSDIADKVTGLMATIGILLALWHRAQTGEGQEVEVPMFETMVAFNLIENLYGAVFDPPLSEPVYPRVVAPGRRPYATQDGYIAALVYNDKQWERFCTLVGREDWRTDARFATYAARMAHIETVYAELEAVFRTRNTADWLAALDAAEIPAMPVLGLADLFQDVHLRAIQFFQRVVHPTEGPLRQPAPPIGLSKTPGSVDGPAPRLGEHSRAILQQLGYDAATIEAWVAAGVIREPHSGGAGGGNP
jgi:crotonobetainyl-CoA:carnitine CoA-transferase CaiB-like acyl-CoA transferase